MKHEVCIYTFLFCVLAIGVFFYEPQSKDWSVGVENSDSPYLLRKSITERLALQDTIGISQVHRFENGNYNIHNEKTVENASVDSMLEENHLTCSS